MMDQSDQLSSELKKIIYFISKIILSCSKRISFFIKFTFRFSGIVTFVPILIYSTQNVLYRTHTDHIFPTQNISYTELNTVLFFLDKIF